MLMPPIGPHPYLRMPLGMLPMSRKSVGARPLRPQSKKTKNKCMPNAPALIFNPWKTWRTAEAIKQLTIGLMPIVNRLCFLTMKVEN